VNAAHAPVIAVHARVGETNGPKMFPRGVIAREHARVEDVHGDVFAPRDHVRSDERVREYPSGVSRRLSRLRCPVFCRGERTLR
jgi:hypothetical protein